MDREGSGSSGKNDSFKAHRDVFFFTLQRELEKVRLALDSGDALGLHWTWTDPRSTHFTLSKNEICDYASSPS